jgi:uncharacterized protein
MSDKSDYYVYVYIDPRNFEEFYYGKGQRDRKDAHLKDRGDSKKTKRIKEILAVGQKPIIKVIARNLTEHEAFLVEKTLIWKLGSNLTNMSSGYFSDKFRPHNEMYKDLYGFDFQNGIYYFNVDERHERSWIDCQKFGFLSAGGGKVFGKQIQSFNEGDVVVAYVGGKGYVGVGVIVERAVIAKDFRVNGKRLSELDLTSKRMMEKNINNPEKSEYLVKVKWKATCETKEAKWIKNGNLFTARMAKASLQNQKPTIDFISSAFKINITNLLKKEDLSR